MRISYIAPQRNGPAADRYGVSLTFSAVREGKSKDV